MASNPPDGEPDQTGNKDLSPAVSGRKNLSQQDISEIRNDLKRDNVERALNRLSDLVEACGPACDKQIRHTSILLMQEYARAALWKINNQHPPEVLSRVVGNISLRALELCDALVDDKPSIELTAAIEPDPIASQDTPAFALPKETQRSNAAQMMSGFETGYVVEAQGISRVFKTSGFRLEPLDLTVRPGKILAIVGMNGSGKSTLLDILRGEAAPESGKIRYPLLSQGRRNWTTIRSQIGYVAQRSSPWRGSVSENLEYAAAAHGIVGDENVEWTSRLERSRVLLPGCRDRKAVRP
jgi:ABC-type multidrug transport system fused ATPase/permease subunit